MKKFGHIYLKMYICTPKNADTMKKSIAYSLIAALSAGSIGMTQAQAQNREAMEHELAITAYNYAAGCAERHKYEEALEGLSHIPSGQLNAKQQAWADSLRMQCEAMVGHPMAAYEVAMTESEMLALDDQSDSFLRGIRHYQAGNYAQAIELFDEVVDMGQGPRKQVCVEALFWLGQCHYQIEAWEECCQDLIKFNDTKTEATDAQYDALAYYTMGYARMQQKKWHHSRLNFERYIAREANHQLDTWVDGNKRYEECRKLEKSGGKAQLPLGMNKVEPNTGETVAILSSLQKVDVQKEKENQAHAAAVEKWRDWRAPYIEE